MKNLILVIIASFLLTGCSILPRLTTDTPNTVPQSTQKSKVKEVCRGKVVMNENGDIIECARGYYNYEEDYNKAERKYTLKEKIINFFRKLSFLGFWIVVALVIFLPGTAGLILGRIIEGIFGMSTRALRATVRGVQNARKHGKNIDDALSSEQDNKVKKYIRRLKEEEKLK